MKKRLIALFFLSAAFSLFAFSAQAQNVDDAIKGLNDTARPVTAFKDDIGKTFDNAFLASKAGQVIGLVLSFVGVLFLGLMIYAGLSWMTANGNEQTVSSAKALILNASIGIIIVFGAYAITSFLGNEILK